MNRPQQILLRAASEDIARHGRELREVGWPTEIVAFNDDNGFGVRLEIRLEGLPVPLESLR